MELMGTSETHLKLSRDQKNAIQTHYSYLKSFKTYMYELRENSNNIAYILRQIQQEDSTIQNLLRQITNPDIYIQKQC